MRRVAPWALLATAPFWLYGAAMLVEQLGAPCPGDWLDNPDAQGGPFNCRLSGGLLVAAFVSTPLTLLAVVGLAAFGVHRLVRRARRG